MSTQAQPFEIIVGAVLYGAIALGTAYLGSKLMVKYIEFKLDRLEKK